MVFKKLLLVIVSSLLTGGHIFSQNVLVDPVSVEREDGSFIRYYLEPVDNEQPSKNLFLFLQGSDCNSVRNIPSGMKSKIKSIYPGSDMLSIEKYGITDALPYSLDMRDTLPESYVNFDNPKQRVSDANNVLNAVVKKYGYEKVLVFGGSEGATVAYMLASECNYISATATVGGGGRFFIDDVIQSIRAADLTEDEKEKEIEGFKQFAQYILSQEHLDFSMGEHGFLYWKTMLSVDQQEIISRINTPLLILQGGKDMSASSEKTTEMVDELKRSGKNNIDYYFYPEYGHSLDFSEDDGSFEKVMNDIQKWTLEKLN